MQSGYKQDPILPYIKKASDNNGFYILDHRKLEADMDRDYRKKYFIEPGLVDSISLVAKNHNELLLVSFYRFSESGLFSRSDKDLRSAFWKIIAEVLLLHYTHRDSQNLKTPLGSLSARERDVCEGILQGLTTEAIACKLDIAASSVTTYRRRSYQKLGINSKTALFTLCQQAC
ncbi:helix-turn-helix transcriptional regulator [Porticoccus sp. GXU_MW_L64]